ncbi:hypothetical protein BDZ90DRAFT_262958 [Jaminaea rosea]|uniref:Uncharacterized protein n=1 Tax=Jaminaea rosea TaxID=1569628 RepID=A0A316UHQ3_9BASI|nr:hypothetical protein BDZ90DRAFT_262958 [Jaminaea rosea]PWN24740.1 hypothetical protein BDZ90DRAFT_262958 [Jaminaea rosea]
MTAPVSPTNGLPSHGAIVNGQLQLNFDVNREAPALLRRVVPIAGLCPPDEPQWPLTTQETIDRRDLRPFTVRYQAQSKNASINPFRQDDIHRAVRHHLRPHFEARKLQTMPAVIFEQDTLDDSKDAACNDLICPSALAFIIVINNLKSIKIESASCSSCFFARVNWTNSLPPNVMPFDLLRLSVSSSESESLLGSLKVMLSGVGLVLGVGRQEIAQSHDAPFLSTMTVRGYVELNAASMALPFHALVDRIPTHFRWRGELYSMWYPGRPLHKVALHSQAFPIEEVVETEDGDPTLSPDDASSQPSTEVSTPEATNKRKRSE